MDQFTLAVTTSLFIVCIIFILIGTKKYHANLKKMISIQDHTIKNLRDEISALYEKVDDKERHIVNLAANNALMKQKIVNFESEEAERKKEFGTIFNSMFKQQPTNHFPSAESETDEVIDNIRKNLTNKSKNK